MKKLIIILISILFMQEKSEAQNVIIKQDVNQDFEDHEQEFGPNKKYYNSSYTSFGLLFGAPDHSGSAIDWYKSFFYETGTRHKRQMGPVFAIGHDVSLNFRSFSITQNNEKTFGGLARHKSERLFNINANFLIYTRFNFKPYRGNQLGKYIDLAAYVEYAFITRHMVKDKVESELGSTMSKSYYRGLPYLNKWNYGATVRLGLRNLVFFCSYRLSDMFNKSTQFPYEELPRFCAGISFDVPDEFSRDR